MITILSCFKAMSDDDPEGARVESEAAQNAVLEAAGVDLETWRAARSRVLFDGHYGPVSDEEWHESNGEQMPLARALQIVRDGMGAAIRDVHYVDPRYPYETSEDGIDEPNMTVPASQIRRCLFRWYHEIYG